MVHNRERKQKLVKQSKILGWINVISLSILIILGALVLINNKLEMLNGEYLATYLITILIIYFISFVRFNIAKEQLQIMKKDLHEYRDTLRFGRQINNFSYNDFNLMLKEIPHITNLNDKIFLNGLITGAVLHSQQTDKKIKKRLGEALKKLDCSNTKNINEYHEKLSK